jgi:RNA polymerase sigma factor (sigma-70 family)
LGTRGDPADERAFEDLFATHRDDLTRFAARRVGVDAAPDVVSEVFLTAWRRWGAYRPDEARLWLFAVARLVIANEQRGQRRRDRLGHRAELGVTGDRAVIADLADEVTLAAHIQALLERMPAAEQEALRLTEWDQFDHEQAAVVAGCSRATFRVRLHRARRHFARLLAESDHDAAGPVPDPTAHPIRPSMSGTASGKD